MIKEQTLSKIKFYFPQFEIKYKDQSSLMKWVGKLMFFNKNFMTHYTTTLGNKVYFPSESYVSTRPLSSLIVVLHELVHIQDHKKLGLLFSFLYASPQIFALLALPFLLLSWKLSLLCLLFLSPIPSFFRMYYERKAYIVSLYSMKKLGQHKDFKVNLASQKIYFVKQFKDASYYFMWPFASIEKDFDAALAKIEAGERPFEDKIFDILDEIISAS